MIRWQISRKIMRSNVFLNTLYVLLQAPTLFTSRSRTKTTHNKSSPLTKKLQGGPYGENLAASYPNTTLAIDAWASEESHYNYAKKKFTERNGHFTQLVWQSTTDVGCANIACDSDINGDFLVCEYWPRGNVQGEFGENVRKPGLSADGKPGIGSAGTKLAGPGLWMEFVVLLVVYSIVVLS